LDLGLPPNPNEPIEGFQALAEMLAIQPLVKVVILSGQSERENALRAIGAGAYDFVPKPAQIDELKIILKRAFNIGLLEAEYRQMQARLNDEAFEGMMGACSQMQTVFASIRK